jgi:hypothetical protein
VFDHKDMPRQRAETMVTVSPHCFCFHGLLTMADMPRGGRAAAAPGAAVSPGR